MKLKDESIQYNLQSKRRKIVEANQKVEGEAEVPECTVKE